MSSSSKGIAYGVTAYFLWGLVPLYFPLVAAAGPVEILAHRIVWSLGVLVLILALWRHWGWLRAAVTNPRQILLLSAAALVVSVNWGLFIYAVNSGNTLQASLAYFINPLVSVALGVVVLAERLRPTQWVAVGLGATAVVVLTVSSGAPPWLALGMAFSFATYGLTKKFVRLDGLESLSVEMTVLFLPALGFVLYLQATGTGTFTSVSTAHTLLLVGAGVVTALPLLAFGAAAYRIPLTMVGLLQFIAPVMQFLIAWLVFAEDLSPARWAGFAIVWTALAVFATDLLLGARRRSRAARAEAAAVATATPIPDEAPPAAPEPRG